MSTVARVALNNAAVSFDQEYSYLVGEELLPRVSPGKRVIVPFGKGNRRVIGFITRLEETNAPDSRLKALTSVIDGESLVNEELMGLIFWLREHTFCTYYDAYKTVVPAGYSYTLKKGYTLVNTYIDPADLDPQETEITAFLSGEPGRAESDRFFDPLAYPERMRAVESLIGKGIVEETDILKRRVGDENVRMAELSPEFKSGMEIKLTGKQKAVVGFLEECGTASVKEICYMTGCTATIIKRLTDKGVLREYLYEVLRSAVGAAGPEMSPDDITLNEEQQAAFDGIAQMADSGRPGGALLYGVTGSGKTSVFVKVIDHVLKQGRGAMLLVPEISLTPQTVDRFKKLFGDKIALIHSSLSLGQRLDEFKRIRRGEARIVIGTRSAVFAPMENIGVIIMDEEGESSYKSDHAPRYHARDVAMQRCGYNKCLLLMASATPSLESFYGALDEKRNSFRLFELKKRYSSAPLPEVTMIDMQNEAALGNDSLFSRHLADKLAETLDRGEQAILLLNRRGFNTYVVCRDCREPVVCPKCRIPLTYHKRNRRYMCHYCGYTMDDLKKCPSCGSDKLKSSGVGTQRVEDEIGRMFPKARLLRMDADTASSRYSYETNFKAFGRHEYDIMLGTQMIAKGLDFPNVTLVGVISLDKALFTGDFRSYERTFSLLTQVVGRSGRGGKKGEACIQTFVPEHYVLALAARQDYRGFYEQEIALRQALIYPPFCDICVIGFSSPMESKAITAADKFCKDIGEYIRQNRTDFPLRAIGPAPCTLETINGKFRYRLILKTRNTHGFREMIRSVMSGFYKNSEFKNVNIYADINGDIGL